MKLDEALSIAEDRIRASLREEKARLVTEIEAMRRQHAAKGLLRSGATLKRIRDLGIESLSRRIEMVFSEVTASVEVVTLPVKDAQTLMPTILQFFPEDLDDQGEHIRKAVADVNVPNALAQLLDALASARANELQKTQAKLQLFVARAAEAEPPSTHARVFGVIEAVLLAITFGLALLWIKNPSGPFEPYLVLLAAIVTGIDFLRKWERR